MKRQSVFAETADRLKKPRPQLLDKREAKAKVSKEDREQNQLVKIRSRGQCEVRVMVSAGFRGEVSVRCQHHAEGEPHHLIYGIGRRNVGRSIKAAHKLAVCRRCHSEIHGAVLRPANELERYEAATVRYERIK